MITPGPTKTDANEPDDQHQVIPDLGQRRFMNYSTQDPPFFQALLRVKWKENEIFGDVINQL